MYYITNSVIPKESVVITLSLKFSYEKGKHPGTQKLTVKPSKHPQDWGLLVKFCCGIYLPALFSKYFSKETSAGFC